MAVYFPHIYQLIPLLLLTGLIGNTTPFLTWSYFSSDPFLLSGLATLTFLTSFGRKHIIKQYVFLMSLSYMVLIILNHLWLWPSLGTLIIVVYILLIVQLSSPWPVYKRYFLTPTRHLLICFLLASLFTFYFITADAKESLLILMASTLASTTVIHISAARLKISLSIGYGLLYAPTLAVLALIFFRHEGLYLWAGLSLYTVAIVFITASSLLNHRSTTAPLLRNAFNRPELVIIGYFLIAATAGTFFLQASFSQAGSQPRTIIDSFFTAMSAVSVSGLTVLDTSSDFSTAGHLVIFILMQMGGLGIVSISAWTLLALQSGRLSVAHENTIYELSGDQSNLTAVESIKKICFYFFSMELCGALVLFLNFYNAGHPDALWHAIFTSTSAFTNAGFALRPDSLLSYQNNPTVIITTSFLIFAGGIAPLMAIRLPKRIWKGTLNIQEKLCLITTLLLIMISFILFATIEWHHSLAGLSFRDKILNSFFQSITSRSGGLTTVDFTSLRDVSYIIMMIMMFIGGNPGGMAGGIKSIAAAVIFLAGWSAVLSRREVHVFNRKIPHDTVYRCIAIAGVGVSTGFMVFLVLSLTQDVPTIPLLFDTISALGTTGLSLGAIHSLDEIGKFVIAFCMFVISQGDVIISAGKKGSMQKFLAEGV